MTIEALSDIQVQILETACTRKDDAILPLPDGMTLKGAALTKALATLANRGFVQERGDGMLVVSRAARKAVRGPIATKSPQQAPTTQQASLLALLRRKGGAALADLMAASGWQAHSVRGFLSGTVKKRMGLTVGSKRDGAGERRYAIVSEG